MHRYCDRLENYYKGLSLNHDSHGSGRNRILRISIARGPSDGPDSEENSDSGSGSDSVSQDEQSDASSDNAHDLKRRSKQNKFN